MTDNGEWQTMDNYIQQELEKIGDERQLNIMTDNGEGNTSGNYRQWGMTIQW